MDANYVLSLSALAKIYHEKGKIKEAVHYYRQIIEINPNFENAYFNLGLIY